MIENIRRVVMGETGTGESRFTHVETVPEQSPGSGAYHVWGYDEAPALPWDDDAPYVARSVFPPIGGLRVLVVTMGGSPTPDTPLAARAWQEFVDSEPAGMTAFPGVPGLHSTDTIDIGFVLSGSVATIASDGTREVLEPGDVYIQNGAPHSWENVADGPSKVAFVVVPAARRPAAG